MRQAPTFHQCQEGPLQPPVQASPNRPGKPIEMLAITQLGATGRPLLLFLLPFLAASSRPKFRAGTGRPLPSRPAAPQRRQRLGAHWEQAEPSCLAELTEVCISTQFGPFKPHSASNYSNGALRSAHAMLPNCLRPATRRLPTQKTAFCPVTLGPAPQRVTAETLQLSSSAASAQTILRICLGFSMG